MAKTYSDKEIYELARGNVESNLCADWDYSEGDPTPDYIYDDAYTLAFDKLVDEGVDRDNARKIAQEVAQSYAQP